MFSVWKYLKKRIFNFENKITAHECKPFTGLCRSGVAVSQDSKKLLAWRAREHRQMAQQTWYAAGRYELEMLECREVARHCSASSSTAAPASNCLTWMFSSRTVCEDSLKLVAAWTSTVVVGGRRFWLFVVAGRPPCILTIPYISYILYVYIQL